MSCDRTCPEDCQDECPPLCQEHARVLDFAVTMLIEMDKNIPEEADYENVQVSCNAARLAEICDLLLTYSEIYEDVNTEEMFEFADIEASTPKVISGNTKH